MKKERNYSIEFLRFLMAVIIVNFHFFHTGTFFQNSDVQNDFYFLHGATGVEFFFLISGFLMAKSAQNLIDRGNFSIGITTRDFILRKIKSFIVPAYVAWLFTFVVAHLVPETAPIKTVWNDAINSIFELLFLRNAGFRGVYTIGQTWYISGMLLSMLLCFPLMLKYRDTYLYVIAPLSAFMILGYLNHEYKSIVNTSLYLGVIYKMQLRSIGVINLGAVCFAASLWLKNINLTKIGMSLLSIVELVCYAGAIYYMCWRDLPNKDYVMLFFLIFAVTITFSQKTWLARITDCFPRLCSSLGRFSLALYLSHIAITGHIIPILTAQWGEGKRSYVIGMILIFICSWLVQIVSTWVERKLLPALKPYLVNMAP